MSSTLNRRGLFALLGRPLQRTMEPSEGDVCSKDSPPTPQNQTTDSVVHMQHRIGQPVQGLVAATKVVAVIQGRRCLALTSFCAACVERCPVPGAMNVSNGLPSVVPEVCTGCGICQEVCPAPSNAVLMLPRRQRRAAA